ncbi:hypothetical protein E4T56_gene20712 [Termitomyces sp. T112]|nr:hypothetical protein E4T56_gene20712 [Termitomyces sp. T112]
MRYKETNFSTQDLLNNTLEMEAANFAEIVIFDAFACLGLFLNVAVLAPTLFAGVCRKTTWAGLILSFILYAITYLLLIGRQRTTQHPPYGLCFLQASLVYSSPLLCAVSYTSFGIDFYLQVSVVVFGGFEKKTESRTQNALVIMPWVAFCFQNIITASLAVSNPSMVQRSPNQLYCIVTSPLPPTMNCIVVIIAAIIVFPLDIHMTYILYKNSGTTRRLSEYSQTDISFSLYIRLVLFTLVGNVALGLSVVSMTRQLPAPSVWGIVLTTIPIIGAITFGAQTDIIRSYIPRKGKQALSRNHVVPDP